MRDRVRTLVALVLIVTAAPNPGHAGIVDTPLPIVDGQKLKLVYTVTGLTAAGTTGLESAFFCTSLEKTKNITVAIETFNHLGALRNDVTNGNGVRIILHGETRAFETNDIAAVVEDETIVVGILTHGSARILSDSRKLECTAALYSASGTPPAAITQLPVFKKTTQKGD